MRSIYCLLISYSSKVTDTQFRNKMKPWNHVKANEYGDDNTVQDAILLASVKIGCTDNGLSLVRVFRADTQSTDDTKTRAWVEQAVDLLQHQWPRGASQGESYNDKLIHGYSSRVEHYGLPCSYLLLKDDICVG